MEADRDMNDILRDVVALICPIVIIENVVDNGDGTFDITVCEKFYMQKTFEIEINSVTYRIEQITGLVIKIKGSVIPIVGPFALYKPFFFHGTIKQTSVELGKVDDSANKTPMVYNLEIFREKFKDPTESPTEFEAELRLFFLTQAQFEDWNTNDFYTDAIKPMKELAKIFFEKLETFRGIGFIEDRDFISHTKFGVFVSEKGYETLLFADKLSGVEVRMIVPVLNQNLCKIC